MNDVLTSISNREFAALIWLGAFLVFVLSREKFREPLQNVIRAFFQPVIVIPLLLAAFYAAAEITLLRQLGWWSSANLKTTLLWVITFAFVSMFEVVSAKDRKAGLGRITGEILTVTVVLTFIVELHSFSLLIELIALPLVTMLVLMAEVAKHQPEHAAARKLLDSLAALIGLGYFGFSLWMSYAAWQETATWGNALEFLIPLLLSLGFLPFLYGWIIYVTYNDVLTGISIFGLDKKLVPRARWLAITRIRTDLDLLERWRQAIQQTKPSNRKDLDHSLTALLALREREASPPVVPPQDGWSPYLAMQFLADRSFDTGHYHHSFDGEWYASTPMREFGTGVPMPDNLAYYVEGTEHAANTLKLKLNINNPASVEAAETWFIVCCMELLEQSVSLDAVERMKLSIAQLDDFQEEIPFGSVSLRREDYVGGIQGGYSRYFEIKRGPSMMRVGILAYGSLISDPGAEIAAATIRTIADIETPFPVEFARSSDSRGGAPTLVPVSSGGLKVRGRIIVVDASAEDAAHMLYRREIHKVGSGKPYKSPPEDAAGKVRVKIVDGPFENVATVLYTDIDANIADLTAERLASLAIASVATAEAGKDGISYLLAARNHGIRTALSDAYEAEILRMTGTSSLENALRGLRGR